MAKELLINVSEGEECRIALVEDGVLEELYMERTSSTSHVGNVYKGRVMNVEPSIQAAFVDFGLGRNGFLHISDLLPSYFGRKGDDVQEFVGKKMARRDRPPIQRCLRRGDDIIVQVIKEGIGTKGPTLSAYLSISGKMLVMMPGVNGRGVSRKIEDEDERRRLKQILDSLDPPEDCGFIIRTESVGKSKAEIERDLKYLARLWEQIKKKRDGTSGPVELYTEGDLVTRTVRDVFSSDVDQIVIDNKEVARRVKEVIKLSNPRAKNRVDLYEEPIPLFHKYGIEREIEQMYSRHVPLRSGGSLVIDSTEAIVAIDVNSGKNRENSDAEMTAFKTDMEAADEICRQLKLRDLGGVIIVDFIDLRFERHRRDLGQRLHDNLKRDRAKTKVLPMSQFGIIEMTRQRMRPSFKRSVYFDCPHCKGAGLVKTPESMSLDVMRRLAIAIHDLKVARVELSVNPDVSFYLQNKKRQALAELEHHTRKRILIKSDATLGLDEMRLDLFDMRDGVVIISELTSLTQVPHKTQLNTRQPTPAPAPQRGGRPGGRPDDRRPGQRPPHPQPQRGRRDEPVEDREDFDRDEVDAMEDRADQYDRGPEDEGVPSPDVSEARAPRESDREADGDFEAEPGDDAAEEARDEADEESGEEIARTGLPRNGAPGGDEQQPGEGGRKRRRRRRRRRGRGRGGAVGPDGQPLPQDAARPDNRPRDEWDEPRQETRDQADREESGFAREEPRSDREEDRDEAPERESREQREDREDLQFDRELRDIESRVLEDADSIVEEDVIEADEDGTRTESIATSAYTEHGAPGAANEERAAAEAEEAVEAKPAKRGRPRGGRGRAKKKVGPAAVEPAEASTSASDVAEPEATPESLFDEAGVALPGAAKPKRRRGRRGKGGKGAGTAPQAVVRKAPASGSAPGPKAGSTATKAEATSEPPVIVRTGSTDRHLADEEPVLHEPVRRPRSFRDLDHIPDDYD